MTFSGFACKGLNKRIHYLNVNCVFWHNALHLPSGMIVLSYAFYGRERLYGQQKLSQRHSYEADTKRKYSRRFYGIMLRLVVSMEYSGQAQPTYHWKHLRYPDTSGPSDDIYISDDCDDIDHWKHLPTCFSSFCI